MESKQAGCALPEVLQYAEQGPALSGSVRVCRWQERAKRAGHVWICCELLRAYFKLQPGDLAET